MATLNLVYSYSRCSTCRKALTWLEDNEIPYETLDIVETPPSTEQLTMALNQLGAIKNLFNTSGKSYRELGAETVKAMNETEAIQALALDGKLIKRPFLIDSNKKILVGFKLDEWNKFFFNKS